MNVPIAVRYTASGTSGHRLTVMREIESVVVFRTDTDDPNAARIPVSE